MKAFEIMIEEDRKGNNPLFRDRNWQYEERLAEKTKQNTKLVQE